MSREHRRHPVHPCLEPLEVSRKSVIPSNQTQKNKSVNPKSKSKRKADRHV